MPGACCTRPSGGESLGPPGPIPPAAPPPTWASSRGCTAWPRARPRGRAGSAAPVGGIVLAVRLFTIAWAVTALLLFAARQRSRPQAEVSIADRLRATLERLGPTFVKLGQALSLRRDVLPDEYVAALHQLQDHVAPFPGALARREVERELGRPIEAVFADFEDEPLAAASIAQVHRARLDDGTPVIVKVRRPPIRAQIDRDMRILSALL